MATPAPTGLGQSKLPTPRRSSSMARKKTPSETGSTHRRPSSNSSVRSRSGGDERTVKRLRLSKALTISDTTTVADACKRMATRRVDAALLTNSSALLCGIMTDKDVAMRVIAEGLKPEETLVSKVMTRNPSFVMGDSLAVDALQKMVQGKFRHLPVVENGEVVALLDITKCLYDAIARMERAAEKGNAIAAAVEGVERQWGNSIAGGHSSFVETLREKMFRPTLGSFITEASKVSTVSPSDTIYTAAKKMRELKTSYVIVTVSGNKPHGILTSKDVLMRVVAAGISADTVVEKVMTPNPECATLETTIVDALHVMHDGRFLHLPVISKDGHVVACVDVLQLTHAAFATVGTSAAGGGDVGSAMMQKFWDSAFALEPSTEEDDDSQSDISARLMPDGYAPEGVRPNNSVSNAFAFKLEDRKGRIHRFQCGVQSLSELISIIKQRLGDIDSSRIPQLMYEDDEGDRVLLASDSDLIDAVNFARVSGSKGLRLFLDRSSSDTGKGVGTEFKMKNKEGWGSSYGVSVAAGAAAVAGISLMYYLKRSGE